MVAQKIANNTQSQLSTVHYLKTVDFKYLSVSLLCITRSATRLGVTSQLQNPPFYLLCRALFSYLLEEYCNRGQAHEVYGKGHDLPHEEEWFYIGHDMVESTVHLA